MAEIDPLEKLARLARREEPPKSDVAAATMRKVRASDGPRPAPAFPHWRLVAAATVAASATVAAVLLPGRMVHVPVEPAASEEVAKAYCDELDSILAGLLKVSTGAQALDAQLASAREGKGVSGAAQPAMAKEKAGGAGYTVPALDVLGTFEREVNKLLNGAGT